MKALLKPVTTAVNAVPTARPMAIEMTFPRSMKSLNPFSTGCCSSVSLVGGQNRLFAAK